MNNFFKLSFLSAVILLLNISPYATATGTGDSGGGGPGVAIYIEGKDKTPENLIRVESIALYKARRSHSEVNWISEAEKSLSVNGVENIALQYTNAEVHFESIKVRLNKRTPWLGELMTLADGRWLRALQAHKSAKLYLEKNGEVGNSDSEIEIKYDFGQMPTLKSNEKLVQIVKRVVDQFSVNMTYWNKMSPLDQLDTRIHEDVYAVSFHKNSVKIQEFQLALLKEEFTKQIISEIEFRNRLKSEWNIVQYSSQQDLNVPISGITHVSNEKKPYTSAPTPPMNTRFSISIPDLYIHSQYDNLQCGYAKNFDFENGSFSFVYLDENNKRAEKKYNLNNQEVNNIKQLTELARAHLYSRLNPLMHPAAFEMFPIVCLVKSLFFKSKLKFINFRLFESSKEKEKILAKADELFFHRLSAVIDQGLPIYSGLYSKNEIISNSKKRIELYNEILKNLDQNLDRNKDYFISQIKEEKNRIESLKEEIKIENLLKCMARVGVSYGEYNDCETQLGILELNRAQRDAINEASLIAKDHYIIKTPDEVHYGINEDIIYNLILDVSFELNF